MTSLEQALARILASIEDTEASGNSQALTELLQRKDAICAALAAPEHSWHDPRAQVRNPVAQRKAA